MNKKLTLGAGSLVALALIFAGVTILLNRAVRDWRIDLTQNHLFTLAPGTDRILAGLKEPIDLYFYFSADAADQYPQIKTYAGRVQDLLEQIADRAHGKLRLHIIDPQPFSDAQDRATELGVRAIPVGSGGESLYFGLAGTNSTNGHDAIAFFDPSQQQFLEYDVMKLLYELSTPNKPVIGWLSSLPMQGGFDPLTRQVREPWVVFSQMKQLFDVRVLHNGLKRIDPSIRVLVLVHPKHLDPATLYAIDQFALRGGRILAFVDPLSEQDTSGDNPSNPVAALTADHSSNLEPLLPAWGVHFDPKQVIGDAEHALQVTTHEGAAPARDLAILGLGRSSFDPKDVITAGLSSINVATAGFLTPEKRVKVRFVPLIRTSAEAAPIPASRFVMLSDPTTLENGFHPTGKRYTIAARVTGMVKSAYPDGPPKGVAPIPGEKPLTASVKPLNLVVVADTDMLADFLWVREQNLFGDRILQPWASNGDFVSNALDNLSGSDALISVRGRAEFTRPFTRVEKLRAVADQRYQAKEQELESELKQTEAKLTALQSKRNDKTALILTPDQQQQLEQFQLDRLRIRKQLRAVRLSLDESITRLGDEIKVINIIGVPALIALIALLIGWRRRRRMYTPARSSGSTHEKGRSSERPSTGDSAP
jgi:gliding motility-associatede transport system auxiliary component